MDGSYPSALRVWDGPEITSVQDLFGPPGVELARSLRTPLEGLLTDMAEPLFICESLRPSRRKRIVESHGQPFSLQWFLSIEHYRHGREARWLPRVLEFTKHPGETVLGLGFGLGTDWLQFARHGAAVIVCSGNPSQLTLIQRNFQLRGLEGRFLHASATALPLESGSIDVVCINGLLQQVAQPQAVVEEVYRLLKPGGKVIALTAAKYDVDFWADLMLWWRRWLPMCRPPREPGLRYSRRRLSQLFRSFEAHRLHRRQLRRSEIPHLWRLVPVPLLERVLGRVLILKAFKPVSTAIPLQAAA